MTRLASAASLAALAAITLTGLPATAQCTLTITSVYTCDANGSKYSPSEGDTYYVRVNWTVSGTPKAQYGVKFTIANQTWTAPNMPTSAGTYWAYAGWTLPLAGSIPFKVQMDPANITGHTNTTGLTKSGSFTPVQPATPIAYYDPVTRTATETNQVRFTDVSGTITSGYMIGGAPVSDSFQQVVADPGPAGATRIASTPAGDPIWQLSWTNFTPIAGHDTWNLDDTYTVTVSSTKANVNLLNKTTWAQMTSIPASVQPYLQPDTVCQSNDPSIASFVTTVLGSGYQTKLHPFAAAKKLFLAIVKRTTYQTPIPTYTDDSAVDTLKYQIADCGGFSSLFNACVQYIGIPARTVNGWWTGQDNWHIFSEFYLPNCGWVPADGSEDKLWWDPKGKFAYMFAFDPDTNQFCANSRGTAHDTSNYSVTWIQDAWWYYWGSASWSDWTYGVNYN